MLIFSLRTGCFGSTLSGNGAPHNVFQSQPVIPFNLRMQLRASKSGIHAITFSNATIYVTACRIARTKSSREAVLLNKLEIFKTPDRGWVSCPRFIPLCFLNPNSPTYLHRAPDIIAASEGSALGRLGSFGCRRKCID